MIRFLQSGVVPLWVKLSPLSIPLAIWLHHLGVPKLVDQFELVKTLMWGGIVLFVVLQAGYHLPQALWIDHDLADKKDGHGKFCADLKEHKDRVWATHPQLYGARRVLCLLGIGLVGWIIYGLFSTEASHSATEVTPATQAQPVPAGGTASTVKPADAPVVTVTPPATRWKFPTDAVPPQVVVPPPAVVVPQPATPAAPPKPPRQWKDPLNSPDPATTHTPAVGPREGQAGVATPTEKDKPGSKVTFDAPYTQDFEVDVQPTRVIDMPIGTKVLIMPKWGMCVTVTNDRRISAQVCNNGKEHTIPPNPRFVQRSVSDPPFWVYITGCTSGVPTPQVPGKCS
jgi:hypothetical protein